MGFSPIASQNTEHANNMTISGLVVKFGVIDKFRWLKINWPKKCCFLIFGIKHVTYIGLTVPLRGFPWNISASFETILTAPFISKTINKPMRWSNQLSCISLRQESHVSFRALKVYCTTYFFLLCLIQIEPFPVQFYFSPLWLTLCFWFWTNFNQFEFLPSPPNPRKLRQ